MTCQVGKAGPYCFKLIAFTHSRQVSNHNKRCSFLHQKITEQNEKNDGMARDISLSEEEQPRWQCDGFESQLGDLFSRYGLLHVSSPK